MQVTYFFLIGSIQPLIIIWTQLTWTSNILQRAKSLKLKKETQAKAKFSRQKIIYKKKEWAFIFISVVKDNRPGGSKEQVVIWFEEIETMRLCLIKLWHYVNNSNKSDLDKLENQPTKEHTFLPKYIFAMRESLATKLDLENMLFRIYHFRFHVSDTPLSFATRYIRIQPMRMSYVNWTGI